MTLLFRTLRLKKLLHWICCENQTDGVLSLTQLIGMIEFFIPTLVRKANPKMFSRTYILRAISAAAIIVFILAAQSNTVWGTNFISPTEMAAEWSLAISDPIAVDKNDFDQMQVAAMPMVLSGETLTIVSSGAEGLLATPASDPIWGSLGSKFTINYDTGAFLPFGSRSPGAVWNMSNPHGDNCADSFHFFNLVGSSCGFETGLQTALHGSPIAIAWDRSVSLLWGTIYDMTVRRAAKKQKVIISEQGGSEIVNVSFMDATLNSGSFGHYSDNLLSKAEWSTSIFRLFRSPNPLLWLAGWVCWV